MYNGCVFFQMADSLALVPETTDRPVVGVVPTSSEEVEEEEAAAAVLVEAMVETVDLVAAVVVVVSVHLTHFSNICGYVWLCLNILFGYV